MKKLLTLIMFFTSLNALACSFPCGYQNFVPAKSSLKEKLDGGNVVFLPAPQLTLTKLVRGSAAPGSD